MHPQKLNRRTVLKVAGSTSVASLAGCTGSTSGSNNTAGSGDGDDSSSTGANGGSDSEWEPSQNLTIVVPWGAGGGTDTATRSVANPAEKILQEERGLDININIKNITGAAGLNGARRVVNQPADGYTLFANTNVIAPNIAQGRANFKLSDWAPMCRVQHDTSWLYTSGREGKGHGSIDSLIQKAKEDSIQVGVVGGITGAAFVVLWAEGAGILDSVDIVSYDDAGRQRTDTISGEIDASFGEIQELKEQQKSGDIKLLLVGAEDEIDQFPDIPATGEKGWDVTYGVSRGVVAKSGTPSKALNYWKDLWHEAMQSDSYQKIEKESLVNLREGWAPPKEYEQILKKDLERYKHVVEIYG